MNLEALALEYSSRLFCAVTSLCYTLVTLTVIVTKERKLGYTFEWDPRKAKRNWRRRKISFERAAEVFLDPFSVSIFDEEHSDEEEEDERWILIGKDSHEVVLVVVRLFRNLRQT